MPASLNPTCDKLAPAIPTLSSESAIATSPSPPRIIRFGVFEVELAAGEVRKAGLRQKLTGQPFQLLQALLERPGEVVTRDELRQRLWPEDTFVDYELALKKAVNRLREVLGDSAESPRFIETIPRRGYRFIAPVQDAKQEKELGRYRITAKIGAGGMGEVYLAQDTRLGREVAIKVLPPGALLDENARSRFRREAEILSKLSHPNIATVYDFEKQQDKDLLVMEYVRGVTLSDKLAAGPLSEKDVLRLGLQLTEGIEAAHEHGVIHRDLKPGNLRVTPEGWLKILDFGLAKSTLTTSVDVSTMSVAETGSVRGTLRYMAPEQLLVQTLDARTDIYAVGSILYEMTTGQAPFYNQFATALVDAILHQSPRPPRQLNSTISVRFEDITLKCLEKEPANRYQSAKELAVDLRRVAPATTTAPEPSQHTAVLAQPSGAPPSAGRGRAGFLPKWIVSFALLVLAGILLWLNAGKLRTRIFATSRGTEIHSIAVLPFKNLSKDPEQEYFVDGMTDELITDLAKIGQVRVISRTSVMSYKGTAKSLGAIAGELNVDAIVEGTVLRDGNRVRVTAQLLNASPERHLWADTYQGNLADVFSLQDRVARSIAREIRTSLTPEEQVHLANMQPAEPEAYDAYVRGRYYASQINPEGFEKAVVNFSRSIELQPRFARAYADLAETYCWEVGMGVVPPQEGLLKARQAAMKALEIDNNLGQAHSSLAWVKYVYEWNFPEAEKEFQRSLELNPNASWSLLWYGMYLAQANRIDESLTIMKKVQQVDPLSPAVNSLAVTPMLTGRQYDVAIEGGLKVLEMDHYNGLARWLLTTAYERKGDLSKATDLQEATEVVYGATKESAAQHFAPIRRALQISGPKGYWRANLDQSLSEWKKKPGDPYDLAVLYARVGDKQSALTWLEKAYQARSQNLIYWMRTDPAFDPIRSEPVYVEMVRRIGFPQ